MSKSSRSNSPALNRRDLLRLSTVAGVGAVLPTYGALANVKGGSAEVPAGTCSTPSSAIATTQYGKVRGYVEDGVLTFKGVPYGAPTSGENRWLPAKAPTPWDGEYPALIYGANCPQRLHDWVSEQSFLFQWTDGWQSEDMEMTVETNQIDNNVIWNVRNAEPGTPGQRGCAGSGIFDNATDKLIVAQNLIGRCDNSALFAITRPDRRGSGTGTGNIISNNIFAKCDRSAIVFLNPGNEANGNVYVDMDLDSVESRGQSVGSSDAELLDDLRDLVGRKSAGSLERHHPFRRVQLARRRHSGRCNWQGATRLKESMRDTADVPELEEDSSARPGGSRQ